MKSTSRLTRFAALLLALFLIVPAASVGAATAAAGTAGGKTDSFDYFKDAYPSLKNADGHVFKTATYEDLVTLFKSEGTFAILFGGAWSAETQADIGYINETAKAYGIQTIYNFDPKLDGKSLDIADSKSKYAHYYVDLVNKYLTNLTTIANKSDNNVSYAKDGAAVTASKIQAPFLFVYNKDNKNGSASAPIIASLEKHGSAEGTTYDASYFASADKAAAYKAQVQAVLGKVPAADYDALTSWEFIGNAFNQTFWSENPKYDPATGGTDKKVTIFTKGVDNYDVFEHVTYDQLTRILQSEGNYVFLFGGSWCPNTQADIRFIGEYAKKHGVDKIYLWDTKLTAGVDVASSTHPHNNEELQVRANNHEFAKLYGDLASTYLTNIKTQNKLATPPAQITYVNDAGQTVKADRLQVPYLFAYNKSNLNADGTKAPILGHVELMYSWTGTSSNVDPAYVFGSGIADGFNHKSLTQALDALYGRVEAVPAALTGIAPTAAGASDGEILGATGKLLEYKAEDAPESAYQASNGEPIKNLAAGSYSVRYAAKNGYQGPVTTPEKLPKAPATAAYEAGQAVTITVPQTSAAAFEDVAASAWYSQAVNYLSARGITGGTDATHFSPNAELTRGAFIVLLLKAYGVEEAAAGADNFVDAGSAYYTGYLAAAKQLGIATGDSDNRFNPNQSITREQLFTLLYRTLKTLDQLPAPSTQATLASFGDANLVAGYAKEAVEALVSGGILTGSDGKLNPQGVTTRAQAAQVLYNLLAK
ncbi:S-layer homology domain-containing protein [Paenibacillus methanolicus]|uniref:S-layer family protein n=1 Tax=Paenibacillus methanolicus TaxID=582686 RepID=A0A5S5BQW5_9BACL|nr:S-layer homology domain-containing protein [Paenibacillus methanolicus]TYP69387.1 S-layer family protein [Paenibacillus methanolicus]